MMPAPESHLGALTDYEIKLFKKWIHRERTMNRIGHLLPPKKDPLPKVRR